MIRERPRCGRSGSRPSEVAPRTGEHCPPIMAVRCPPFGYTRAQAAGYQRRKACGSHFVSPAEPNAEHFCCRTPPNAPKKRRANPARPTPNAEPRRKTPPARQRSKRHPTDTRTGAVSRGCFPARRGYLMRRSPEPRKRHPHYAQNGRRDRQARKPDERGKATAANGAERTRQAERHQTDEQAREGAPPDTKTGRKNETRDPRRAAAAERTICTNEANRPQAAFAGRAGLLREPFLRLAYSPEGVPSFS